MLGSNIPFKDVSNVPFQATKSNNSPSLCPPENSRYYNQYKRKRTKKKNLSNESASSMHMMLGYP
jgi:hypothetical protein